MESETSRVGKRSAQSEHAGSVAIAIAQETYIREEVEWNFVEYEDNQHTIDLISKRPVCIYGLLDEGCASGAGTDSSVLQNFNGVFKDPKKHRSYIRPKKSADKCFTVSHYAVRPFTSVFCAPFSPCSLSLRPPTSA